MPKGWVALKCDVCGFGLLEYRGPNKLECPKCGIVYEREGGPDVPVEWKEDPPVPVTSGRSMSGSAFGFSIAPSGVVVTFMDDDVDDGTSTACGDYTSL
jgi:hypothetical protein